MKMHYEKPSIELIDFALSSSIANQCGAGDPPAGLFDNLLSCTIIDGEGICYHNPTDDTGKFGS